MELIEKLEQLMKEKHLNKNLLSKETGIPYTTIDAFFKNGTENMKLSNLRKLAKYFNVSLDYLADDSITDRFISNKDITNENSKKYYLDDDAAQYAQQIFNNPTLRILFDASQKVSRDDLEFVVQMVNKLKRDN